MKELSENQIKVMQYLMSCNHLPAYERSFTPTVIGMRALGKTYAAASSTACRVLKTLVRAGLVIRAPGGWYYSSKITLDNAPVGTKAPSITGGHWVRTPHGWKWNTGSTFPRPGGNWDGNLILPFEVEKK